MNLENSPEKPGCHVCGKQEAMLFRCNYCGGRFCAEHRLPENHGCTGVFDQRQARDDFPRTDTKKTPIKTVTYDPIKRRIVTQSHRIVGWLRVVASYLFTIGYILIFSLPVGVAVMVSNMNLDPLTRVLLKNIIYQINLFALGYALSACYLFYQKVTRKDTYKAYGIVAIVSIVSAWMLLDKAAALMVLNTLLGGQAKSLPNIVNVYQLWMYVLLDNGLSLIVPLVYNYSPERLFINNMRHWIADRVQQIL